MSIYKCKKWKLIISFFRHLLGKIKHSWIYHFNSVSSFMFGVFFFKFYGLFLRFTFILRTVPLCTVLKCHRNRDKKARLKERISLHGRLPSQTFRTLSVQHVNKICMCPYILVSIGTDSVASFFRFIKSTELIFDSIMHYTCILKRSWLKGGLLSIK